MLLARSDVCEINAIKQKLKLEFEMKELGTARILGIEIKKDKIGNKLLLKQQSYISKVLHYFLCEAKTFSLLLVSHLNYLLNSLLNLKRGKIRMKKISYANSVIFVMYIMVCTRPNIVKLLVFLYSKLMKEDPSRITLVFQIAR